MCETADVIVVAGEALIDLVISPSGGVETSLGGAPYNTARACGRLGAETAFVGALSVDRFGTMLTSRLEEDGVETAFAPRVDEPTTLAAAELDDRGAASYRFYIDGTSAPALVTPPDLRSDVLFAGGLGLVFAPMADTIEAMVSDAGASMVMIDVNCRPLTVVDRDEYVARVARVVARADVVKVSDDDLRYLAPDLAPIDAARRLLADGARVVLLTAGGAGAHVLTAHDERFVPAEPVDVVDTVGAGDTFGAGFLTAWTGTSGSEGEVRDDLHDFDDIQRLVDAAAFGAHVAAVVCGRRGADPPWRDEVEFDAA
jgi:fructokinase